MLNRNHAVLTLALIGTTLSAACAQAPAPLPTFDPNSIETFIAQTAGAAARETAHAEPPTQTPPPPPTPAVNASPAPLNRIAFASNRGGGYAGYAMNADGGALTSLPGFGAWSPDGSRIVFTSERDDPDPKSCPKRTRCNSEIYVADSDGENLTRLTNHPARDYSPAWSPDGRSVAFVSDRDDSSCDFVCNSEIYVMDARGFNLTRLTINESVDGSPVWSPDGKQIAFIAENVILKNTLVGNRLEIYTINVDGTNARLLDNKSLTWGGLAWSPDGQKIAFTTIRDDPDGSWPYNSEIYVMNADGTNPIRLTDNPVADDSPNWSPDGRILFVSYRDEPDPQNCGSQCNGEIYIMNADGSNQVRLTYDPAGDLSPLWLPVGAAAP